MLPAAPARAALAVLTAVATLTVLTTPAAHADDAGTPGGDRTVTFDVLSRHVEVDDVAVGPPPPGEPERANNLGVVVRLPKGYHARPKKRWPVLYLLHGAAQAYDHWSDPQYGDIATRAKGLPAIVVMPQGGVVGFYADWYTDGTYSGPGWESYYLRELIPEIEQRYRIREGRRWHAIAGLSMGGYGAMYLASQLPGYFGSAASFSGALSPQDDRQLDLAAQTILAGALPGFAWRDIYGPPEGFNAVGHNPSLLMDNLRHTRLFVSAGDATPCPGDDPAPLNFAGLGPQSTPLFQPPLAAALGPPLFLALEVIVRGESETFLERAEAAGVETETALGCGIHWWDTFNRAFDTAKQWGFHAPTPAPRRWSFTTAAQRGEAWGLRFRLAQPPTALTELSRTGSVLRAAGEGRLQITTPGCRVGGELPFEKRLPASCGLGVAGTSGR